MDTKPRELYHIFHPSPGYESSLLKVTTKNGLPTTVGFVTFTTYQDANEAMRKLQGVRFDPELPQTIRLELAKSNTKVSTPELNQEPTHGHSRMTPTSAAGLLLNPLAFGPLNTGATSTNQRSGDLPVTLFVSNLGRHADEQELFVLFSKFSGFRKLKLTDKVPPVAFVKYANIRRASHVLKKLQGATLPSLRGKLMNIKFSRTDMD